MTKLTFKSDALACLACFPENISFSGLNLAVLITARIDKDFCYMFLDKIAFVPITNINRKYIGFLELKLVCYEDSKGFLEVVDIHKELPDISEDDGFIINLLNENDHDKYQ